jgi:hypothetical protein
MNRARSVTAEFAVNMYPIAASSGSHGSIHPSGTVYVAHGSGTNFTIRPDPHYHVAEVTVDGVAAGAVEEYSFSNVTTSHTIHAPFAIDRHTLGVASAHGTPVPAVGIHTNDYGLVLTNSVTGLETHGETQYVCTGWVMTGNEPASGTTNAMTMTHTNDAVLTWQWTTNYWLGIAATNGAVTGADEGWKPRGFVYDLVPSNAYGYVFDHWETNGAAAGPDVPLTLTMVDSCEVRAVFRPVFIDVTSDVNVELDAWTLDRQTGTLFATLRLCNDTASRKRLLEPFWYAVMPTLEVRLMHPDGITDEGFAYVDITAQVLSGLPTAGNGDTVLDPGECVAVSGIEFYSIDRTIPEAVIYAVWADPPSAGDVNLPLRDTDADGIPNYWEEDHAELDPNNPFDAVLDADGDGMSNLEEFQADTDPGDPGSLLWIVDLRHLGGTSVLTWLGGQRVTQYVEQSRDLDSWYRILTNVPPTSRTNTSGIPAGGDGMLFYRIRVDSN